MKFIELLRRLEMAYFNSFVRKYFLALLAGVYSSIGMVFLCYFLTGR